MIKVGKFLRVLKSDGVLLFKSYLKDSDFLSDIKFLFTSRFSTKFNISKIQKTAKGFHIKFKEVENWTQAEYFVNEEMTLPESELEGKTLDILIGKDVFDYFGKFIGKVIDFTETPEYYLLSVQGEDNFFVPFTKECVSVSKNNIKLLRDLLA